MTTPRSRKTTQSGTATPSKPTTASAARKPATRKPATTKTTPVKATAASATKTRTNTAPKTKATTPAPKPTANKKPAVAKQPISRQVGRQKPAPKTVPRDALIFPFDICTSFAGENRAYVEAFVRHVKTLKIGRRLIKCFYDLDEQDDLWGRDLYTYLDEVYQKKARFCVMFTCLHYRDKLWTNHERKSAQAREFQSGDNYLLVVKMDATDIPGIRPTLGYLDGTQFSPQQIAEKVQAKLKRHIDSISPPRRTRTPKTAKTKP